MAGGRTFAVAFAVISALLVGLIVGFAGGYFVAQRTDPIPPPRSAAQAVIPVPTTAAQPQTYTDALVPEKIHESAQPEASKTEVGVGTLTSGSLQLASRPAGAQVFVDDVRVGVTPMSLADVSAGSHRVRIELPGFRRWATTVNVESGARARVGASLER